VYQNGYSGGVAIGYHKSFLNEYFIGGELSASAPTDEASFASGASSTAFNDKLSIGGNIDLSLISGFALTDSTSVYARIGLSYAAISTEINTPTGFTPSYVNSSSSRNKFGGGFGLGFKKFVTTNTALFTEYQYHDYGTVNFPNFQNFTATYSHSARVYTQNLIIGLAYAL
jgi:opacity protein-like surface antigen